MTLEKIRLKLLELHQQEDEMNYEIGDIDKQIRQLKKKKQKLTKRISGNMKFRNRLINEL